MQTATKAEAAGGPADDAAEVAAGPALRFLRLEVAGPGALATSDHQREWCGPAAPAKVLFRLVVGCDAWPGDPAAQVAAAGIEAARPLDALRDALLQGEPFRQAERLGSRLAEAEGKANEAVAAAQEALAAARSALAGDRAPDKAERDYRARMQDAEVFRNRAAELRRMHAQARADAQAGLVAALVAEQARLLAEAEERDERESRCITDALAALLPRVLAAKAARLRLQEERHAALRGDLSRAALAAARGQLDKDAEARGKHVL